MGTDPDWGGHVDLNPAAGPYPCGAVVTATAVPEDFGQFVQWSGDFPVDPPGQEFEEEIVIEMDADKEITATFELGPPIYHLTVATTECLTITVFTDTELVGQVLPTGVPEAFTITANANVTLTAAGGCCNLDAWMLDGAPVGDPNVDTYSFPMDEDHDVVVESHGPPFVLTALTDPADGSGGDVVVAPEQVSYTCDVAVDVTAVPTDGWEFVNWLGEEIDGSDVAAEQLVMNEDKTVTAVFAQEEYEITFPPGTVDVDPDPPYHYGDEVTFTAIETGCNEFLAWEGDLAGQPSPTTVVITGPMAFTPTFGLKDVTLTVFTDTFGGPGSVSVTPPGGVYSCGVDVELTATPTETFDHWEGDWLGSDNPTTVPMTDDREITAVFGFDPDTMVVTIEPEDGTVPEGGTLQFTVTVTDAFGNAADVTTDPGTTFTTTAPGPGATFVDGEFDPGDSPGGQYQVCVTYEGVQECTTVTVGEKLPEPIFVGQVGMGSFVSFDGVDLTVRFDGSETVVAVDANGVFTITDDVMAAGTYTVCVKEFRALALCAAVVAPNLDTPVPFGDIVAGDGDNNNTINFDDFTLLGANYNSDTYLEDVDYDNSQGVPGPDFDDFTTLGSNYGLSGDSSW
jgi:hypothetical protein